MDEGTYWSSLSTESLRLDGDRDEEKRQRTRRRREELRSESCCVLSPLSLTELTDRGHHDFNLLLRV